MAGNAAPIYPGADPLSETRAVHLGPGTALAEHCGTELLRLDVATPAEAVRAIMLEHPGARKIIEAGQWMIRDGDHLAAGDWDLTAERGRSGIYILPAGEGAGDGIGKVFAGIALVILGTFVGGATWLPATGLLGETAGLTYLALGASLAYSGVSRVNSPTPLANPMDLEASENRQGSIFSQPSTLSQPGQPVPLVYGICRVGGLRISGFSKNLFHSDVDTIWNDTFGRIAEVVAEAEILSVSASMATPARQGVYLGGSPISPEQSVSYALDGSGSGGSFKTPSYRQIPNGRLVKEGVPVTITILSDSVDSVVLTFHWSQLFTGSATLAPSPITVAFDVEISASGSGFVTARAGSTPVVIPSTGPTFTGFGSYLYRVSAPSAPIPADYASFTASIGQLPIERLEFTVSVIWDSSGSAYQYPNASQEFDVFFRVASGVPPAFGPWLSRRISVYKTEEKTAVQIVGQSHLVQIDQNDMGAPSTGATVSSIEWYVDAIIPGERPEEMCVFANPGSLVESKYGSVVYWWAGQFCTGVALSGYALDIEVLNLSSYGSAPWIVRVTRTSPDLSPTSLSKDEFKIAAVQEVISATLDYTGSAIAIVEGVSELFSPGLPKAEYILEGAKIAVPTGYDPAAGTFASPWDGAFQASKMYSNDPAWILWDLLTASYGLGIDPARIDKWSFALASRRNLTLVPDLVVDGANERRYTWNGALSTGEDGFKVASQIAACMDAQIWISTQGSIFLGQDSPQTEISRLITQANVIGGLFAYEGTGVNARRNVSTATYRNSLAEYKPDTVRADRQFSMERYGETPIETDLPGVTSTGQAIRAARRILITDETENQTVRFQIGLENSGIQPGDLIEIADASRAQEQTGARIASTLFAGGLLYLTCGPNSTIGNGRTGGEVVRWLASAGTIEDGTIFSVFSDTVLKVSPANPAPVPISEGAPVIVSTATPETWRVLEVADDGEGLYTVLAVQHVATKWAAIDDPTDLGTAYTFPADTWPPPGFPS